MRKAVIVVVSHLCTLLILFSLMVSPADIFADVETDLNVKHKPIEYFVPDKRIQLKMGVKGSTGVKLVRCYFRASDIADYVFVEMPAVDEDEYTGILPAPSPNTKVLEYLFLIVDDLDQVAMTQAFKVESREDKDPPSWQQVDSCGQIIVGTEVTQPTSQPEGFSDNIAVDLVESSVRFGTVAGLYSQVKSRVPVLQLVAKPLRKVTRLLPISPGCLL